MTTKTPPELPFAGYKWRWATAMPTESLNDPPVFLGVLRMLQRNEGKAPNNQELHDDLLDMQNRVGTRVKLARTPERNLLRNSRQYWAALGVIENTHALVSLTPFGRLVSNSLLTETEFALTVVRRFTLPNPATSDAAEVARWKAAGLEIRPLQLLLEVIAALAKEPGDDGYITAEEVQKVVIPLAGQQTTVAEMLPWIRSYRRDPTTIAGWPNCTPRANDHRMVREFLLFLANYGLLRATQDPTQKRLKSSVRYSLAQLSTTEVDALRKLPAPSGTWKQTYDQLRLTPIPATVERSKVARLITERRYQGPFRRNTLKAYGSRCLITGTTLESVLEAAHIKDVQHKGSDQPDNALCLRSDLHTLFDTYHLRLTPAGEIRLSSQAQQAHNYGSLPTQIALPPFVNRDYLQWRLDFRP